MSESASTDEKSEVIEIKASTVIECETLEPKAFEGENDVDNTNTGTATEISKEESVLEVAEENVPEVTEKNEEKENVPEVTKKPRRGRPKKLKDAEENNVPKKVSKKEERKLKSKIDIEEINVDEVGMEVPEVPDQESPVNAEEELGRLDTFTISDGILIIN